MNPVLKKAFFERPAATVARDLLGMVLVSRLGRRRTSGIIVETEAYLSDGDPACHGTRGRTRSNAAMFGPPGRAYVYPIHAGFCFNVVTAPEHGAAAVLIRALEPRDGIHTMSERRGVDQNRRLTTGPSCLCQALQIDRRQDHHDLTLKRHLWIERPTTLFSMEICQTVRIGVTSAEHLPLRFAVAENPFVSGPKRLRQSSAPSS